jgi:ubiquinone/menaquinone biosynthesis C-methylase UbiE
MKISNQEKVWDNIAEEWHEFKKKPAEHTIRFLKKTHGNVLDLGSGSGRNLTRIKNGKMYLADFSQRMLKLAEKKAKEKNIDAEFIKADLIKLPFKNNYFDFVVCISALHCMKGKINQKKVVKELHRVLKKDGKAEIGVWNINSKRFKNSKKEKIIQWRNKGGRYYYLFDEKEVHNLFKKVGFKILSTHNSEMMINFIVEK